MASFLARAFKLPGATTDSFTDDESSIHESNVNRLAKSGITGGCSPGRYCPSAFVTRGQMAAFLHRAMTLRADGRRRACEARRRLVAAIAVMAAPRSMASYGVGVSSSGVIRWTGLPLISTCHVVTSKAGSSPDEPPMP